MCEPSGAESIDLAPEGFFWVAQFLKIATLECMGTTSRFSRNQFAALGCCAFMLCALMSSTTVPVQADTSTVAYPAEVSASAPSYAVLGQVTFTPKSAVLSASSKRVLASYISKLKTASRVQIKSFYTKPSERSTLAASRSAAVMSYFISRGFVPSFTVAKGTTNGRKTQILWYPKQSSSQVNFSTPSTEPTAWRVPTGARCLYFVVAGAKGGASTSSDPGSGGLITFARKAVPGQSFQIYVGGVGGSASFYETAGGIAGINGGAAGGAVFGSDWISAGGGGGGWSGVFQGSTPIAIAGGGGGAASSPDFLTGAGGDAGVAGHNGAALLDQSSGGPGGAPGTLLAAGLAGTLLSNVDAATGQAGSGRNGGIGAASPIHGAGGGGGGYFGGGGGAYSGTEAGTSGGGGGGSNLVPAGGVVFVAPSASDGTVSIKYSNWSLGSCRA